MKEFYNDQPDGVIGNEDCGQMSAWYIFSSLGFYPVLPASGIYAIGSPLFDKATLKFEDGKKFTIETSHNSDKDIYTQKVELNGKVYKHSYISHQDIVAGGILHITMGNSPNKEYGSAAADRP